MIPFVKMHGCGNDFVVVRDRDLAALQLDASGLSAFVRSVCDRHFGLGADGLLSYDSRGEAAGVRMRYWNRDGGRAEMCGNGARCVVRLAFERGETSSPLQLETDSGLLDASVEVQGDVYLVEIRLGRVRWDPASVGMNRDGELLDAPLRVDDRERHVTALSIGNPHAVVFLDDLHELRDLALEVTGPALSNHELFLRGANASFCVVRRDGLHVRVWERGAGATLACGTASCAVVAAAARLHRLERPRARVHLPGGTVEARVDAADQAWLRGPASSVAHGEIDASLLKPGVPRASSTR
jgi:diaminopimelate epimerase